MKLILALCLTILPGSLFAIPADDQPDSKKSKKQLLTELRICKAQLTRRAAQLKNTEAALEETSNELTDFKQENAELRARLENEAAKTRALNRALDKSAAQAEELKTENIRLKKLLEAQGGK